MPGQLSLPGLSTGPRHTDRLFFGIFPDPAAAVPLIAQLGQKLRVEHGLTSPLLAPGRFHITLFHLGDYFGLPASLVRSASEAGATLAASPFEVEFDRAGSFSGKPGELPFVLRGSRGVEQLKAFQQTLGLALKKAGLGYHAKEQFNPHVTLLRDPKRIPEETVDPVRWTVREFVLVHSLLGRTQYILLGRWPLRGQPPPWH